MKKIKIRGGHALKGQIEISGMKNAALPILFATIVTGDVCVIENLPPVGDIEVTLGVFDDLGGFGDFDGSGKKSPCRQDGVVKSLDTLSGFRSRA